MRANKIHVYCMPGMAASPAIFEYIKLPEQLFEIHYLEWYIPEQSISFSDYAKKISFNIKHENVVLLGVSLGGLLVQEIAKCIQVRKVIIVSSIKKSSELPFKMRFARSTRIHMLLPTGFVKNVNFLAKYAFGEAVVKRVALYERYLSIKDKAYIDWCIDKMVNWQQLVPPQNLVHIQGTKDTVFPVSNIKDYTPVLNGTHTMIIHRAKWFNENLPTIILE